MVDEARNPCRLPPSGESGLELHQHSYLRELYVSTCVASQREIFPSPFPHNHHTQFLYLQPHEILSQIVDWYSHKHAITANPKLLVIVSHVHAITPKTYPVHPKRSFQPLNLLKYF